MAFVNNSSKLPPSLTILYQSVFVSIHFNLLSDEYFHLPVAAERASRQSYSLSSSSSEGVVKETREIQFITPHKKRIIKDER